MNDSQLEELEQVAKVVAKGLFAAQQARLIQFPGASDEGWDEEEIRVKVMWVAGILLKEAESQIKG